MNKTYSCPACMQVLDSWEALDAHRRSVHGRTADGVLVVDARPQIKITLDETALLRVQVARMKDWIRSEGERTNVCTFDVLGGEICSYCRCGRKRA